MDTVAPSKEDSIRRPRS